MTILAQAFHRTNSEMDSLFSCHIQTVRNGEAHGLNSLETTTKAQNHMVSFNKYYLGQFQAGCSPSHSFTQGLLYRYQEPGRQAPPPVFSVFCFQKSLEKTLSVKMPALSNVLFSRTAKGEVSLK